MTALLGTFVKVGTMADGTPRLTLDMQCTLAELAAMGLVPGVPFALARLEKGATSIPQEPAPEPAKGGALAKLAGIWCNDPEFRSWLWQHHMVKARDARDAAEYMRHVCDVASRAELDSNPRAERIFNEMFRLPYMAYCQGRSSA